MRTAGDHDGNVSADGYAGKITPRIADAFQFQGKAEFTVFDRNQGILDAVVLVLVLTEHSFRNVIEVVQKTSLQVQFAADREGLGTSSPAGFLLQLFIDIADLADAADREQDQGHALFVKVQLRKIDSLFFAELKDRFAGVSPYELRYVSKDIRPSSGISDPECQRCAPVFYDDTGRCRQDGLFFQGLGDFLSCPGCFFPFFLQIPEKVLRGFVCASEVTAGIQIIPDTGNGGQSVFIQEPVILHGGKNPDCVACIIIIAPGLCCGKIHKGIRGKLSLCNPDPGTVIEGTVDEYGLFSVAGRLELHGLPVPESIIVSVSLRL